jgi:hypothetical protein
MQDEQPSYLQKGGGLQNTNRRMTGTDEYYRSMMRQNKKANIHDILQREINLKQQSGGGFSHTINNRIVLSNQTSPIKGLSEQYENYRGIDLSSQRSPFKQMNKQLQA